MGYPLSKGRRVWHLAVLAVVLLAAAAAVWRTPELREFVLATLGVPAAYRPVEPYRGDSAGPWLGTPCYPAPLAPAVAPDAWAVLPARFPKGTGCDGYAWRVFTDTLALGLTTLARKPCLDPVVIEDTLPVKEHLPTDGLLPTDKALAGWAKILGAAHWIVPVVRLEPGKGATLTLHRIDLPAAGRPGARQELAAATLSPADPVATAVALAAAAREALTKLGATAPASTPGVYSLLPPAPEELLERLQTRASALVANPPGTGVLSDLALDCSVLGYYLSQGQSVAGLRMLIRGAALAALATGAAPAQRECRLTLATALLFARHTALAIRVLEGLSASDVDAGAIASACRTDPDALLALPDHALLYRVAMERASILGDLGDRMQSLAGGKLPMAYLLAGAGKEFDVGTARTYCSLWATVGDELARSSKDPFAALRTFTSGAFEDPEARAGKRGQELLKSRGKLRMQTAYSPIEPGLLPLDDYRVRSDLIAIPALEYWHVCRFKWGVYDVAQKLLDTVRRALPWSAAGEIAVADNAHGNNSHDAETWAEDFVRRSPANPFAVYEHYVRKLVHKRFASPAEAVGWEYDLASASSVAARYWFDAYLDRGSDPAAAVDALRFELAVDPWAVDLWPQLFRGLYVSAPADEVRRELIQVKRELPHSKYILNVEADLHCRSGNPVAATQVYREMATRFPDDQGPQDEQVRLLLRGHHMGKAAALATQIADRWQTLSSCDDLNDTAERLLTFGRPAEARRLAERAAAIDNWKASSILVSARLNIHEGRIQEGLAEYAREAERYGEDRGNHFQPVRSLIEAGREQEALARVETIPPEVRKTPWSKLDIGRTLLMMKDKSKGLALLRELSTSSPDTLEERDRMMLADPATADHPRTTRNAAAVRHWLTRGTPAAAHQMLDRLGENPFPEVLEVLIECIRVPAVGARCAGMAGLAAWIDLELPSAPGPADLERAHATLSAWWAGAKAGYMTSRMR